MKINNKILRKFLRERVYAWDLRQRNSDSFVILYRNIHGICTDTFTNEKGEKSSIPPVPIKGSHFQMKKKLESCNALGAFKLCRKIAQGNEDYFLDIGYTLKELRRN